MLQCGVLGVLNPNSWQVLNLPVSKILPVTTGRPFLVILVLNCCCHVLIPVKMLQSMWNLYTDIFISRELFLWMRWSL